jgi:hypothetical protein
MREGQESASALTDKGIMSEIKHTWESNPVAILVRGPAPEDYRRIGRYEVRYLSYPANTPIRDC